MKKYAIALLLLQSVALFAPPANPHDAASRAARNEWHRVATLRDEWNKTHNPYAQKDSGHAISNQAKAYEQQHNPYWKAAQVAYAKWDVEFAKRKLYAIEHDLDLPLSETVEDCTIL